VRVRRRQHERCLHREGSHPLTKVSQRVAGRAAHVFHIDPVRVCAMAMQIGPQRGVEVFRVFLDYRAERPQLTFAPLGGPRGAGAKVGAMPRDEGAEVGRACAPIDIARRVSGESRLSHLLLLFCQGEFRARRSAALAQNACPVVVEIATTP
jgi:hypothetical protein